MASFLLLADSAWGLSALFEASALGHEHGLLTQGAGYGASGCFGVWLHKQGQNLLPVGLVAGGDAGGADAYYAAPFGCTIEQQISAAEATEALRSSSSCVLFMERVDFTVNSTGPIAQRTDKAIL